MRQGEEYLGTLLVSIAVRRRTVYYLPRYVGTYAEVGGSCGLITTMGYGGQSTVYVHT